VITCTKEGSLINPTSSDPAPRTRPFPATHRETAGPCNDKIIWPTTSRCCTSTCGATAAAITAAPSSGICRPGPMTCGGCATRSGWTSRWCSAAASAHLRGAVPRSPRRRHPGQHHRGRSDPQRVIEAFGRLGGPEAAAVARRTYADETGDYRAEFTRVCYPLYSATPGWAGNRPSSWPG
jgi:hypothetical protein